MHIVGTVFAIIVLGFWASIFVGALGSLMPQYDCSKHGHKDSYYGCTTCRTAYSHVDKYKRPCCWCPAYDYICGVCYMRFKGPQPITRNRHV